MSNRCDIGLIGLAVMGENLALNIESRGFSVAVFNRTVGKVDEFISGRGRKEVLRLPLAERADRLPCNPSQGHAHDQGRASGG